MSTPAPASSGLKYSDYADMVGYASGVVATATGFGDLVAPTVGSSITAISALVSVISFGLGRILRSKGD